MRIPSPAGSSRLPSNPFMRASGRSATKHRSQTTEPSARRNVTVAAAKPASATRLATERLQEQDEGGTKQHDEHRREDQDHEWEEDLDRRFLCTFLSGRSPTPPHLLSEIAHDLSNRDTKRLALDDRTHEGAHRRRVDAVEHVH